MPHISNPLERPTTFSPVQKFSPLRNKLSIPHLRLELVNRQRLIKQLQSGLNKALILVSAPAGYGKTTLVSSWLHNADIPFAWISLDENDDDPIRFLQNLIAAIQTLPRLNRLDLTSIVQRTHSDGFTPLLNIIIDEIAENAVPFVLVLDDFHTLQVQPVLEMVNYLLDRMPDQMHLALLTRTDPALPLARLRSRGELIEIRAEDLSFTDEEAADFLQRVMGLSVSADDICALEERTEGWAAGLQLAAIAVQDSKNLHGSISAFTGSHYYIIDYLTEEVLNQQSKQVQSFLLQTSILSNLCGELCETVADFGAKEAGEGQAALEALERKNLFIIPLDDMRLWYRYHHLFADVLQLRLERQYPGLVLELHRRASTWYERNEYYPEAIRHSVKAGDEARAADLIEQNGCSLILSGESYTLLKWVEAVGAYAHKRPWLATLKAWALALTGDVESVEPMLQKAERLISSAAITDEVRIVNGSIATIRAYLANTQAEPRHAAAFARQALDILPDGNEFSCNLRSIATLIYGDASWMNGSLEEARQVYLEAVRISRASGNLYTTLIAQTDLAEVLAALGKLREAAGIFEEIIQAAVRASGQKLPLADRVLFGLGKICYEWNDLAAAGDYFQQCIELCQRWGNPYLLAESTIMLSQLQRARGNASNAQNFLAAAERLAGDTRLPTRQSWQLQLSLAREWLFVGNRSRTELMLRLSQLPVQNYAGSVIPNQQETGEMIRMRLLMAHGEYDAALALSDSILAQAEVEKRLGRAIEILVLQALTLQGKNDLPRALEALEQALALAQPEGFVRIFLDEGAPLAKLTYQASRRGTDGGYAAQLLSAFESETGTPSRPAQVLIEPLTTREIEVLKLIECGCKNQAIAAKLYISIPTVKRHISNIYGKLGAKNRTQAVSLARELGLFRE